jgi:iron complex transport system substrate-binding protein
LILAIAALVAVAGCGDQPAGGDPGSEARPNRIVSLSPTATETLFAIGAGRQVIAVDGESDFPPAAPRTELSGFQPNVEAIASHSPDLVVLSGEGTAAAERGLERLGVPVVLHDAAASLPEAYGQIHELGRLTGRVEPARRVVRRVRAEIDDAVDGVPAGTELSVYHELSPDYFSAGSATFIGRIYRLLGLENIADRAVDAAGTGYPQLSSEHIVAADPDLIVLADIECCGQSEEAVRGRPGWSGVSALREDGVVAIDDDIASRWGPRIPSFVTSIATAIETRREAEAG